MREHRDAVKQAARLIARTWFGARANQEAKQKNGALYRNNTLRNVRSIAAEADAAVLRDAFGGLPALVIGAGPSLDRNIADIAAHRDRALIIAADTALRPLLAAGIPVVLYTINDGLRARRQLEAGVAAVITDQVDQVLGCLERAPVVS